MTIVRITGGMLRAARSLTGLSQQELAERASISRPSLTAWEGSSGSVPNAKARALHRVVAALEAEGIRVSDGGDPRRRDGGVRSQLQLRLGKFDFQPRFSIKKPRRLPLNRALMAFARLTISTFRR